MVAVITVGLGEGRPVKKEKEKKEKKGEKYAGSASL